MFVYRITLNDGHISLFFDIELQADRPLWRKEFINGHLQFICETKGERKRWVIFVVFDCVYGLAGNAAFFGQFVLGKPQFLSPAFDDVFHISLHTFFDNIKEIGNKPWQ